MQSWLHGSREPVLREALDLLEELFGKRLLLPAQGHPRYCCNTCPDRPCASMPPLRAVALGFGQVSREDAGVEGARGLLKRD